MSVFHLVSAVVSGALFVYLLAAMLRPEKFE
ncbi:K(+)-transporting ATPase subunit F [Labilithrix luteola]|nr:K(+)-transporting ATPase subunit F [Labilithrix luteola]